MTDLTEAIAAMSLIASSGVPVDSESTPERLRERYPELRSVQIADEQFTGPHGSVPARSYLGPLRGDDALVWVHGGSFVLGDLDMPESDWVAAALAARGVPVVALDYRKAVDGVHYPVPSNDVLAGWEQAAERLRVLGVSRIHLGGASAGSNLVAGVAKRLRDSAAESPHSLVLVYPAVHASLPDPGASVLDGIARIRPQERFSQQMYAQMRLNYGGNIAPDDPYAFPSEGELAGLPPSYILAADGDDLRSSAEAFAQALHEAGVNVRLEHEPGTVHGYLNRPNAPEPWTSITRLTGWILGGTHQTSTPTQTETLHA